MRRLTLCLLAFLSLLVPMARAASIAQVIITPAGGGQVLTFSFDPSQVVYSQSDVTTFSAATDFGSGPATTEISFYNALYAQFNNNVSRDFEYFIPGGPPNYSAIPEDYDGTVLFTGATTSPNLIAGTYNVIGEQGQGAATLQLVLTPEPSSLLLLATGLAGIGLLLRRKVV